LASLESNARRYRNASASNALARDIRRAMSARTRGNRLTVGIVATVAEEQRRAISGGHGSARCRQRHALD
jgi:hypothetical protein